MTRALDATTAEVQLTLSVYMYGSGIAQLVAGPMSDRSAASLLSFCQFVVASSAALVVGLTLDGTTRPMALTIAVAALGAFVALRVLHGRRSADDLARA